MDDDLFDRYTIPVAEWVEAGVDWLQANAAEIFLAIRWPIEVVLDSFEMLLLWIPWYIMVLLIMAIGWYRNGWRISLLSGVCLLLIGFLGYWEPTMTTLSMIITAVAFCVVIGVPLGILSATNDRVAGIVRPALDAMQTIHPFVYLVPIVIFFRVGNVPGTMATIIFALPPIVRLTNLGIRQVPHDVVEAGRAFGSNQWQLLTEVQLPLARSTIMAGLNQTLMLALSMVVIVALIGGGGLGEQIFRSVGRVDTGGAVASGLAVMLLAIALDRISQVQRSSNT